MQKMTSFTKIVIATIAFLVVLLGAAFGYVFYTHSDTAKAPGAQVVNTPSSFDTDGSFKVPSSGEAKPGAHRVDLVIDPHCPGCGALERLIGPQLEEMNNSGDIDLHVSLVSFLDAASTDRYSSRAASALALVGEKDPQRFMAFLSAIMSEDFQPKEGREYSPVSDADIAKLAEKVGVGPEVVSQIPQLAYQSWALENTERLSASKALFPTGMSTPALFIDRSEHTAERVPLTELTPQEIKSKMDSLKVS